MIRIVDDCSVLNQTSPSGRNTRQDRLFCLFSFIAGGWGLGRYLRLSLSEERVLVVAYFLLSLGAYCVETIVIRHAIFG